ncbi:MAG: hypothetical protein PHG00_13335 [Methylococcales bacterium]|nr:hypothetical protein [Methylococcales bacterium]
MDNEKKTHGSEWPHFDLMHSMKITESSKKVLLVDQFRNSATLEAIRLASLLQRGDLSAGFSIIDVLHSIPHYLTEDLQLKNSRRQLQHFKRLPAWRYTTPEIQAIFYQLAMLQEAEQSDCQLTPFTVNLTPNFVNKALQDNKSFIDYIKRKIDKTLQSELSRKPQYWFVVELAPAFGSHTRGRQRPHIHGGIITTKAERESVRKQRTPISEVFHKAVGKCNPDFSERLLVMGDHKAHAERVGVTEIEASINWARYCFKYNAMARLFLNSRTNLTADNATKRQAETLYSLLTPKGTKPSKIDENELECVFR